MKRIVIFIGLKITEVAAIVLVPYWVGTYSYLRIGDEGFFETWGIGFFLTLAGLVIILCVGLGIYGLVCGNLALSKKLNKKIPKASTLLAAILIVGVVYFSIAYIGSPKPQDEEITLDPSDILTIDFDADDDRMITIADWEISSVYDLLIYTKTGKELRIDISTDELRITGDADMNEAAEIFFNEYIKEMADAYIRERLKEPEPLADK